MANTDPFGDSGYIPRSWMGHDYEAWARMERSQRMLEPLRINWTDEDKAWLLAMRIKVN